MSLTREGLIDAILVFLADEDLLALRDIRTALEDLFEAQGLVVEPSSAVTLAFVKARADDLEQPICVILTGENIAREDHRRLISEARDEASVALEL